MGEANTGALPEDLSEDEKKQLEEEIQRQRSLKDENDPANLLTRGALLRCSCGTHPRRLNLPQSYGVYATDEMHPKMHQDNCIYAEVDNHISYFGVCKSNCTPPNSCKICLEPYVTPEGVKTSPGKVEGNRCIPLIVGNWFDPKDDDKIYDMDVGRNIPCITSNSFLVCKFGGIIEVLTSGQEFQG